MNKDVATVNRKKIIDSLATWSEVFNPKLTEVQEVSEEAYQHNKWFTSDNIFLALNSIRDHFLDEKRLYDWLSCYPLPENFQRKTIGLIMAGNIPMVGFHDLLCVMCAGHRALIKFSSKDNILLPWFLAKLFEIDSSWKELIIATDLLKGIDAAIATGSNNSSRYFKYYFGKYPHIIRKNRGSIAVFTGNESATDMLKLGSDIFSYFGLGCRNVSKLMVPEGYTFDHFFRSIDSFKHVMNHNKYKNNYDYNRTLLLLNKTPHLANDFLMLCEDERIVSPVAIVYYEFYKEENELNEKISRESGNIQCIAGSHFIPFGKTQFPELGDYADRVDTMEFLMSLVNK